MDGVQLGNSFGLSKVPSCVFGQLWVRYRLFLLISTELCKIFGAWLRQLGSLICGPHGLSSLISVIWAGSHYRDWETYLQAQGLLTRVRGQGHFLSLPAPFCTTPVGTSTLVGPYWVSHVSQCLPFDLSQKRKDSLIHRNILMTHPLAISLVISGNITHGWHGVKQSTGGWWNQKEATNSRGTRGKGGRSVPIKLTNYSPLGYSSSYRWGQRFAFPVPPPYFLEEITGEESSLGFLKGRRVKSGNAEIGGNAVNVMHMCFEDGDDTGNLLTTLSPDQNRSSRGLRLCTSSVILIACLTDPVSHTIQVLWEQNIYH